MVQFQSESEDPRTRTTNVVSSGVKAEDLSFNPNQSGGVPSHSAFLFYPRLQLIGEAHTHGEGNLLHSV